MKHYTLSLSGQDLDTIGRALAELPYRIAAGPIAAIGQQMAAADRAAQSAGAPPATATAPPVEALSE